MPARLIASLLTVVLLALIGAVGWLIADNAALRAEVRALRQAGRSAAPLLPTVRDAVAPGVASPAAAAPADASSAAVASVATALLVPGASARLDPVELKQARAVSPFAPASSSLPAPAAAPTTLEEALEAFRNRSASAATR